MTSCVCWPVVAERRFDLFPSPRPLHRGHPRQRQQQGSRWWPCSVSLSGTRKGERARENVRWEKVVSRGTNWSHTMSELRVELVLLAPVRWLRAVPFSFIPRPTTNRDAIQGRGLPSFLGRHDESSLRHHGTGPVAGCPFPRSIPGAAALRRPLGPIPPLHDGRPQGEKETRLGFWGLALLRLCPHEETGKGPAAPYKLRRGGKRWGSLSSNVTFVGEGEEGCPDHPRLVRLSPIPGKEAATGRGFSSTGKTARPDRGGLALS